MKSRNSTLFLCIGSFTIATLTVLPFVETPATTQQRVPDVVSFLPWVITSLILACLTAVVAYITEWPKLRPLVLYLFPLGALSLGIARALGLPWMARLKQYGDNGALESFISDSDFQFGRWLLGLTLLREVFELVNIYLIGVEATFFVQLTGTLIMAMFGIWFLNRKSESIAPWLLTISPIWILFSIGYSEYYPFIAGLVAVLIWQIVSDQQIFHRQTSYVIVGILPALYIGAVPVSAALLLHTWSRETVGRERTRGLMLGIASLLISIEIGGEVNGYIKSLTNTMNLGWEGSGWIFFNEASLVFSTARVIDIWFWLSCATGIACLSLPVVLPRALGLSVRANKDSRDDDCSRFRLRVASRVMLVLAAVVFFLFMNPLLGATGDIDLYFVAYLTLLLLLASRLDLLVASSSEPVSTKRRIMQVTGFSLAPATTALVLFGVNR